MYKGFGLDLIEQYKVNQKGGSRRRVGNSLDMLGQSETYKTSVMGSGEHRECSGADDLHELYVKVTNTEKEVQINLIQAKKLMKRRKKQKFGDFSQQDDKVTRIFTRSSELLEEGKNIISERLDLLRINAEPRLRKLVCNIRNHLAGRLGLATQALQKQKEMFKGIKNDEGEVECGSEFGFINENSLGDSGSLIYSELGSSLIMSEIDDSENLQHIFGKIDTLGKVLKEMHAQVATQGSLIDRIDHNLGFTLESAKRTNKDLLTSRDSLHSSLGSKLVRILIALNLILFFLLVLRHSLRWTS